MLSTLLVSLLAGHAPAFPPPLSDRLGVMIHSGGNPASQFPAIRATGFGWIRTDLTWTEVERQAGMYDFARYDRLVSAASGSGLGVLFMMSYGNPLYGGQDDKEGPRTTKQRDAFARFAAAAAKRWRGARVEFEIWNEPNHAGFWKPAPNARDYVSLAKATSRAMQAVAPKVRLVGPAVTEPLWPFLQETVDLGLLDVVDAVSLHPYRGHRPESILSTVTRLNGITMPKNGGRPKPIQFSEWGYPLTYAGQSEARKARYLVRAFAASLIAGVERTYFYQWREVVFPGERTVGFGITDENASPRSAQIALQKVSKALAGYAYERRVPSGNEDDFVVSFVKGGRHKYLVWTARSDPPNDAAFHRFAGVAKLSQMVYVTVAGRSVPLSGTPQVIQ